jgi:hypothetical protein
MSDIDSAAPWYKDGLRFECTQCGNCCSGAPGFVWVDEEQIQAIADYLKIPLGEMRVMHTRRAMGRISLREYANGDCVFLDPQKRNCTIYPVRPKQCRTWPFWNSTLENEAAWQSLQPGCPGCGRGELVQLEEIQRRAAVFDV